MRSFEEYWNEHGDVYAMEIAEDAWDYQQAKIDELQKENSALVHVIKSRDIQLENEKHEYGELMNKLVGSGMENKEMQKRLDAAQKLIDDWNCGGVNLFDLLDELEQALNGGSDE